MQDKMKSEEAPSELGAPLNGSKHVSRQQQRANEKATKEAMERFNKFCTVFADWMYDTPDLHGKQVDDKIAELNAKWQVYCRSVDMNGAGKTALKDYCMKLYEAYKEELNKG